MMTTAHPRWDEFAESLDQALETTGCNTHRGGPEHESALAILETMDVDLRGSLAFFDVHGGHCDCEAMLNVAFLPCAGPPDGCIRCRHWITDPRGRALARDTFDADEGAYLGTLRVTS
jgi:hypothetical protein